MNETEIVLEKYRELTTAALAKAQSAEKLDARAAIVLDMAARYVSDAGYFKQKGDSARALAAYSYAHGWLDAGARCKLFFVNDNRLFTVDAEETEDKNKEREDSE